MNRVQDRLYDLIGWPDWKTGRQIRREYNQGISLLSKISGPRMYQELADMVDKKFIECQTEIDKIGRVEFVQNQYRRNAVGPRPDRREKRAREEKESGLVPRFS